MWIEGFTNQQVLGIVLGVGLVVLGYLAYRVEVQKARDAAQKVAVALAGEAGVPAEQMVTAVEKFFDLLKDLSVPKIFAISGIVLVFWGLGLLNITFSTGSA